MEEREGLTHIALAREDLTLLVEARALIRIGKDLMGDADALELDHGVVDGLGRLALVLRHTKGANERVSEARPVKGEARPVEELRSIPYRGAI